LSQEDYNNFIRCLNNLKEICNDIDIREGLVRQRSNDRSCIFEFNIENILPDVSMPISDIKKKLDLLKSFIGESEIKFDIHTEERESESYFRISDQYTSIKFMFPAMQFIDNGFMSETELNGVLAINDDGLLLDIVLPNLLTDRIRIVTDNFNSPAIQVTFDEAQATIQTQTQSKDQYAVFMKDIATNIVLEPCSVNLVTMLFKMEHDTQVDFKMYKDADRAIAVNKLETNIGLIEARIYSRSSIVPADSEEG
jgi:hypothetical protein